MSQDHSDVVKYLSTSFKFTSGAVHNFVPVTEVGCGEPGA